MPNFTASRPAQRLAQSLLTAWSAGDTAALSASLQSASAPASEQRPEDDVLELVKAIGTKLCEPADAEETRASVKLLSHLARPRF